MSKSHLLPVALCLFAIFGLASPSWGQDPGGMSECLPQCGDTEVRNAGAEQFFLFHAEANGVMVVATHDSESDLVMEVFGVEGVSGGMTTVDRDNGHTGNELVLLQVNEGDIYYFRIRSINAGAPLPASFRVLSSFVPDAELSVPFVPLNDGSSSAEGPTPLDPRFNVPLITPDAIESGFYDAIPR